MSQENEPLSPDQALRRFLNVLADEAAANASFRNRLLLALGTSILFEGEEDIKTVNPVDLCLRKDETTFANIYSQLTAAVIRKILLDRKLATQPDMVGLTKPNLIALMWKRARSRASERGRE